MLVYRIAKMKRIRDLSRIGARLHGGRWNRPGTAMLYTSETRALAMLEYLVHVPMPLAPTDLGIATIKISDDVSIQEIPISKLPKNWSAAPPPSRLADLGSAWANSNDSLVLRVPSAVVPAEHNILLNPMHRDISRVSIKKVGRCDFDRRLVG